MVLEKDGEDRLDRSCEKLINITPSQGGKKHPVCNKAIWIGHILPYKTFLKERYKGGEDEEEDVRNYWMILRIQGHTGNGNRKY